MGKSENYEEIDVIFKKSYWGDMRGRIALLFSLLYVAQAFPLTLNGDVSAEDLTREKRHDDHSNIADREVRTIISAIVDAILDGDKKKRSEIPSADDTDEAPGSVILKKSRLAKEENTTANNNLAELTVETSDQPSGSGAEDESENEASKINIESSGESILGFFSGSGTEDVTSGDDATRVKGESLIVEEETKNTQPTLPNTARIKREEDSEDFENTFEKPIIALTKTNLVKNTDNVVVGLRTSKLYPESRPRLNLINSYGNSYINEEVDKRDQIPREENENIHKSSKSSSNGLTVFFKNDTSIVTNASLFGNTFGEDSEEQYKTFDSNGSDTSTDEGSVAHTSSEYHSSADFESGSGVTPSTKGIKTNYTSNGDQMLSKMDNHKNSEATFSSNNQLSSDDDDQSSGDEKPSSDEEKKYEVIREIVGDMAKAAIGSSEIDKQKKNNDDEDEETEDSVVKKSIVPFDVEEDSFPSNLDPNLLITTEDFAQEIERNENGKKMDLVSTEDNDMIIDKRSEIPTDDSENIDSLEAEKTSLIKGDSIKLLESNTLPMVVERENGEKEDFKKRSDIFLYHDENPSYEIDPETQAIINDVETHDKRFLIPRISKKYKQILENERQELENSSMFEDEFPRYKRTSSSVYHATPQIHQKKNVSLSFLEGPKYKKINEALYSLVKSILNEDPFTRSKMDVITYEKSESEDKLERDLIDLMNKNRNEAKDVLDDDATKENVVTEVKDFEGFMQALSQQKSLSPWKHDVIVKKLERDLLNHLSIPEEEKPLINQQADELTQISEMNYIKDKIDEAEEDTNRFAEQHENSLKEIKQYAINSLRSIIASLPMKKSDIEELVDSIGRSAWLKMLMNVKKNRFASKKIRRNLRTLSSQN